jgi:hypothetical protein
MARARVVAPPPQDYIPEPLVPLVPSPPAPWMEVPPEEVVEEEWTEGNLQEEIVNSEPSPEELEKDRIAQEKHEELQRQKAEQESIVSAELQSLREENQKLTREKEAAEKTREDQIVKMRQKATEQKVSHQLNVVNASKPSLLSRFKDFLRRRRIQLATIPRANYEQAIINQASVAVPKMLDEIEKMHESLTILEELLTKHNERQKIKKNEKHPRR